MARSTVQALRQRIFAALTSPPLSYSINGASPVALPTANVIPKVMWEIGITAPMPLVAYAVVGRGDPNIAIGRNTGVRKLELKLWVVSANSMSEVTSLYEAVRALLNYADQDAPPGTADLSQAGTGGADQAITVQLLREVELIDPRYEVQTKRWYLSASYDVMAL